MAMIAPPTRLTEALEIALELARRNEELEAKLVELQQIQNEVLNSVGIAKLLGVSEATVAEWTREWERDPDNSPLLNRDRRRGEAVKVLKWDLYDWLKNRRR